MKNSIFFLHWSSIMVINNYYFYKFTTEDFRYVY